jgi:short-subunit dehydrogenase
MRVLITGANSDIAEALARKFAMSEKADMLLASRDMELLEKKGRDLKLRYGVNVTPLYLDITDYGSHASFYNSLDPKPDVVVAAFGYLGDQLKAQSDFSEARAIIEVNYAGAVSLLEIVAADFEKRGAGSIIGVGSVAGERGRQSNYIYGSAKAGFNAYMAGLRNRLTKSGAHALTVLPGFVRTKMTDGLPLPEKLIGEPEQVANDIYRAFKCKRNVVYTLWFWRWIMMVIKSIPEFIFKRMSL